MNAPGSWRLVVTATGEAPVMGQTYADFRGEPTVLKGGVPPRHSGSSGHVETDRGLFYAGVLGMQWVWVEGEAA